MPVARRRRGVSCLLALALTAALLAGLESLLRVLGVGAAAVSSPFELDLATGSREPLLLPDPELGFRLRPHARLLGFYDLDARGWRGPDVPATKAPGTLRLIATGDSSTFGLGVPAEAVWTAVLARILDAAFAGAQSVEVVSAGVPSYSTAQNLVQVRRDLPALAPDVLLLLATGHNDAVATAGRTDLEERAAQRGLPGWLRGLALVRALHLDRPSAAAAGPRPRVSLPELQENLRLIADAARAQHVPLVLVVPPHCSDRHAVSGAERATEALVAAVAQAQHATAADPRADLAALLPREPFLDGIHPDVTGHRLIAWAVAEALVAPDGPLAAHARAPFARAWFAARRHGVVQRDGDAPPRADLEVLSDPAADVPPRFAALRAACADSAGFRAALAARDRSVPLPLLAPRGAAAPQSCAEAGLRLLADDPQAGTPPERDAARGAADALLARVAPREPLAAALVGDAGPWVPPSDAELALARALVAFEAELEATPLREDRLLSGARAHLRAGRPQEALAQLDLVLALDPRCAEAQFQRGAALDRLDRRPEAQAAYAAALELAPASALGQFLRGKSAFQHGARADAEPCFRAAIALDPAFVLARYALAQLLLQQGALDEAEFHLRIVRGLAAGDFTDVPALLQQLAARHQETP